MGANPLLTWEYALGEPLLRFVLNKDKGPLDPLSAEEREVLNFFESGAVFQAGYDRRLPSLLATVQSDGLALGWNLRRAAGGEIPEPKSDDEATRGLETIARDSYCILLSPPDLTVESVPGRSLPASEPRIALAQAVSAHPLEHSINEMLVAEADSWPSLSVDTAVGQSAVAAALTPDSLLGAAAQRWHHQPAADGETFMTAVDECLRELREVAGGASIEIPAYIGLRGLGLAEGGSRQCAFGVLRSPTNHEKLFSPFAEPAIEVDSVIEARFEVIPRADSEPLKELSAHPQIHLARLARMVCLATALVNRNEEGPRSAAAIAWITEATPFGGSGSFRLGPSSESWATVKNFSSEKTEELVRWVERLLSSDVSHVEIAIERLLRACYEIEWGEALIDAVIAWENLLGTPSETVFRVTSALTVLCEPEDGDRLGRQKELAKIYDARSRLVHGDTAQAEPQMRDRAIQIGLEALAKLIEDQPHLLELKKSRKRSDRLLLGAK